MVLRGMMNQNSALKECYYKSSCLIRVHIFKKDTEEFYKNGEAASLIFIAADIWNCYNLGRKK